MRWLNCLFLVLIFVLLVQTTDPTENDSKKTEILPPTLELNIPFNDSFTLSFELERMGGEKEGVEVLRDDNDGNMVAAPADKSEHEGKYKNTKYDASFTVNAFKNQTHHIFTYMGTFRLKEREYKLMTADYNEASLGEKVEKEWTFKIKTIKYKLCLLEPLKPHELTNDDLVATSTNGESFGDIFKKVGGDDQTNVQISRQRNGKIILYMKILVLIDDSTYKKFARFCKNDHKSTVAHLKFYYTHIMNGVSDTYERIQFSKYKMKSVVTALYIARDKYEAPFTNGPNLKDSSNKPLINPVLMAMNSWIVNQLKSAKINWPTFDMSIMFHDLDTGGNLGLAYVKTVCLSYAVGFMRNTGTFETIVTTAHEIGHIMGASHDSGACMIDQQYIMSPYSSGDSGKYNNEKVFSSCSVRYFADHIADLDKMTKNCMLKKPSILLPMNENHNNRFLQGQKYNLNQQCVIKHGYGSKYCGTKFSGDEMCANVLCMHPTQQLCGYTRNNRAFNGTSCENRKWCIMGKCVADSKAPQFTVKVCPYGDAKYILDHWQLKTLTCQKISEQKQFHNLCSQKQYSEPCCKTCQNGKINLAPRNNVKATKSRG